MKIHKLHPNHKTPDVLLFTGSSMLNYRSDDLQGYTGKLCRAVDWHSVRHDKKKTYFIDEETGLGNVMTMFP